jgi:hypothetical protein
MLKKMCDYTYYGDIFAINDVHIIFITYENFERIPLHEVENICASFLGRHEVIQYTLSNRYKVDIDHFTNI